MLNYKILRTEKTSFIQETFDAKLGFDGNNVSIKKKTNEENVYSITILKFVIIGVNESDVKKWINDVNNGISYTTLTSLNNGVQAGSHLITANLIAKETIESLALKSTKKTWYRTSVKSTKSGFKTWKQVNGDVNRFKSVKGAKNIDKVFNCIGKLSSGLQGIGYLGAAVRFLMK